MFILSFIFFYFYFFIDSGLLNDSDYLRTVQTAQTEIRAQLSHTVGSGNNNQSAPSIIQSHLDQQHSQSLPQTQPSQARSVYQDYSQVEYLNNSFISFQCCRFNTRFDFYNPLFSFFIYLFLNFLFIS